MGQEQVAKYKVDCWKRSYSNLHRVFGPIATRNAWLGAGVGYRPINYWWINDRGCVSGANMRLEKPATDRPWPFNKHRTFGPSDGGVIRGWFIDGVYLFGDDRYRMFK